MMRVITLMTGRGEELDQDDSIQGGPYWQGI